MMTTRIINHVITLYYTLVGKLQLPAVEILLFAIQTYTACAH